MTLASAEAREKRLNFEEAKRNLLAENTNPAEIMRSLKKPVEERTKDFNDFAKEDPNRLTILENLATVYDERKELQNKRDKIDAELKTVEMMMPMGGIDAEA